MGCTVAAAVLILPQRIRLDDRLETGGGTYAVIVRPMGWDSIFYLALEQDEEFHVRRFSVLDLCHSRAPLRRAVFTPRATAESPGRQLRETTQGYVLFVRRDRVRLGYDASAMKSFSPKDLTNLGLCGLFGPDDVGIEAEVAAVASALADHAAFGWEVPDESRLRASWLVQRGLPEEAVLLEMLAHESAWVRLTARKLILAGGREWYPAGSRAADD